MKPKFEVGEEVVFLGNSGTRLVTITSARWFQGTLRRSTSDMYFPYAGWLYTHDDMRDGGGVCVLNPLDGGCREELFRKKPRLSKHSFGDLMAGLTEKTSA